MKRDEAETRLRQLIGTDLRSLAEDLGVTVWKEGKLNKGWAGHTIERHLGLPLNSSRNPNLGTWELKQVSLKRNRKGELRVKETMWLKMINKDEVIAHEFPDSPLYRKMRRMILVSRIFESTEETQSFVYGIHIFTLDDKDAYNQVKADYDLIRHTISEDGYDALHGRMGNVIQPRTKGPGHGSKSRAFYVRAPYLARIVGLPS